MEQDNQLLELQQELEQMQNIKQEELPLPNESEAIEMQTKQEVDLDNLNIENLSDEDVLEIAKGFNYKTKDKIKNPGKNYIENPREYLAHLKSDYPLLKATATTIATTNKKLQRQNEENLRYIRNLEEQINNIKQTQSFYEESSLQNKMQILEDKKNFLNKKLEEAVENGDRETANLILKETEEILSQRIALKAKVDSLNVKPQNEYIAPTSQSSGDSNLPPILKEFIEGDGAWYKDPNWFPKADKYLEGLTAREPNITLDEKIYKLRQWRRKQLDDLDINNEVLDNRGFQSNVNNISPTYRNNTVRSEEYRGLTKDEAILFDLIREDHPNFTKEKFLKNRQNIKMGGPI